MNFNLGTESYAEKGNGTDVRTYSHFFRTQALVVSVAPRLDRRGDHDFDSSD